jgi:ribosome-binding factor A
MSRTHQTYTIQSQRMLRVAERVRHALAELLTRSSIDDPVLTKQVVSVAAVRMSPDLRLATIYISAADELTPVLAALERHKKYLRGEIARNVNLKFAPDIRFRSDDSVAEGARIDALLQNPAVQRDLVKNPRQDGES